MSDKRISKMIKSAYDVLGTPSNLKSWKLQESDVCVLCNKSPCNLKHILSNCSVALVSGRYTWRHDRVLKCIVTASEAIINEHVHMSNCNINALFANLTTSRVEFRSANVANHSHQIT